MFVADDASHTFDDTNSVTERKNRLQSERINPAGFHRNRRIEDQLRFLEMELYFTLIIDFKIHQCGL